MEPVPAYLIAYFIRIRRHAGEQGYIVSRMKDLDIQSATDEVCMLKELRDLHFIGLSGEQHEIVFDSMGNPVDTSRIKNIFSGRMSTQVPDGFVLLARGRWYWTELVTRASSWAMTAAAGSVVGAMIALAFGV